METIWVQMGQILKDCTLVTMSCGRQTIVKAQPNRVDSPRIWIHGHMNLGPVMPKKISFPYLGWGGLIPGSKFGNGVPIKEIVFYEPFLFYGPKGYFET